LQNNLTSNKRIDFVLKIYNSCYNSDKLNIEFCYYNNHTRRRHVAKFHLALRTTYMMNLLYDILDDFEWRTKYIVD